MASKYQWETLELMNIPRAEVPAFANPMTWLRFFPDWGIKDLKGFGASVDWRRSFITTSVNPYYNAFIEWQFRVLRSNDKIVFGKRAGIYSPLDGQVCADHDRAEGEGVGPQEYTLVKLRVHEPFQGKLASLPPGTPLFLAPATLRPETMYGQTNCFVLPEGVYGCYRWANGDVYVMSARSAAGLAHQSAKNVNYAKEWGQVELLLEVSGQDLLGTPLAAPRAAYPTVYVLPLLSISMGKGTGVVTSVPSDAPDDFVALAELKAKPEYRKKFGLTDEMVVPFEVVPIINITVPDGTSGEAGWSSDVAAALWCDKLGIKSTKERAKLDEAKHKTYNTGFSFGVMLVGPYKGEKVSVAKGKEKADMVEAGDAVVYFEPEGFVKSRTGEECVVAMTDQWYLKYGDPEWRDRVVEHVNDPAKFTPYSQEILDKFNFTLGWLNEWACSRLFGLGTQLPWDPKWVIESLSDSTIYMAFYTIAHLLQGEANLDGTMKPSPCGVAPEQLNDAVFNFVFLRGPACAETASVPTATLEALRAEFEYWYPMDLRVSGKDLIGNHLTMALYNHAAVWQDRPELWPRGYYTNGHVNLNNEKMAKSTGNFLMLEEAVEKFSADATRLALGFAGDSMENANFETDTANAATSMLFLEDKFVAEVVAEQAAGTLRTGEMLKMDTNVLNEVNRLLAETESCFDKMLWRDGLNAGSAQLRLLRDFYREWCGRSAVALHAEVVLRYVEVSTLVLAPVCPHYAERVWREHLGRPGSVLKEGRWPQLTAAVDAKASRELRFLQKTLKNLRASCAKDKTKAPTKGLIFIADGYNDWKVKTLVYMQTLWKAEKGAKDPNAGSLPDKKDLMQALTSGLLQDPSMAKLKKDVMQFAAYVADEAAEGLGLAALDTTMPFDQFEVLAESREYLSKHLVIGCVLELELYNLSSADVPGDDKKKAAAEPGKPSMVLM
jgi:leucyl-tRNA synthetase